MTERKFNLSIAGLIAGVAALAAVSFPVYYSVQTTLLTGASDPIAVACATSDLSRPSALCVLHVTKKAAQ